MQTCFMIHCVAFLLAMLNFQLLIGLPRICSIGKSEVYSFSRLPGQSVSQSVALLVIRCYFVSQVGRTSMWKTVTVVLSLTCSCSRYFELLLSSGLLQYEQTCTISHTWKYWWGIFPCPGCIRIGRTPLCVPISRRRHKLLWWRHRNTCRGTLEQSPELKESEVLRSAFLRPGTVCKLAWLVWCDQAVSFSFAGRIRRKQSQKTALKGVLQFHPLSGLSLRSLYHSYFIVFNATWISCTKFQTI